MTAWLKSLILHQLLYHHDVVTIDININLQQHKDHNEINFDKVQSWWFIEKRLLQKNRPNQQRRSFNGLFWTKTDYFSVPLSLWEQLSGYFYPPTYVLRWNWKLSSINAFSTQIVCNKCSFERSSRGSQKWRKINALTVFHAPHQQHFLPIAHLFPLNASSELHSKTFSVNRGS